jgi:hypothetical protein
MLDKDAIIERLMGENRQLRENVAFLNSQIKELKEQIAKLKKIPEILPSHLQVILSNRQNPRPRKEKPNENKEHSPVIPNMSVPCLMPVKSIGSTTVFHHGAPTVMAR